MEPYYTSHYSPLIPSLLSPPSSMQTFGFYMYNTSDRIIKDLKIELKAEQERRLKERETKVRRAKRSSMTDKVDEEKAFMFNLTDVCPRCGESLEELLSDEDQRRHLMECVDERKHQEYASKKKAKAEKEEVKEKKREAQEALEREAAWSFLGAQTSQLWLLDEDQLRRQAALSNVDTEGGGGSSALLFL